MNGGFLLNRIPAETVWANLEDQGYEAQNINCSDPNQVWKGSSGTEYSLNVRFHEETPLSAVAVINHTIPPGALLYVFLRNENGWLADRFDLVWNSKNFYYFQETPVNVLQIQLKIIVDAPIVQIGELFLGSHFIFPVNYSWGALDEFHVAKTVETSDLGVHYETPGAQSEHKAPEYRKFKLDFTDREGSHYEDFFQLIRPGKKVFIPSFSKPDCFFGIVPDTTLATRRDRVEKYSISFWEDAVVAS